MNTTNMMLVVAALGLVACEGATDSWDAENGASAERGSKGYVQVVHLSPDAPAVDVVVGGDRRVLRDVEYLGASPSKKVSPGAYQIDIPAAGGVDPVISAELPVEAGLGYTVIAFNELAAIAPGVIVNNLDGLERGTIRLQVIHTAVGVGPVDVWELDGGVKILDDFEFGFYGTLDLPPSALNIGLDLDEDAVPDVTFSVPELGVDTLVNVFAIADDAGVALYAVYLDGTTARVDAD